MRFPVELRHAEALGDLRDRCVVFHGVNKSGSLAMTKVLEDAYADVGREQEIYSSYRGRPASHAELIALVRRPPPGHSFIVGHYLYGAFEPTAGRHAMVTQFRHPLPRVVSCHRWLDEKAKRSGAARESLEDFVVRTRGVGQSQMAQFGIGFLPEGKGRPNKFSKEEVFERAIEAIDRDAVWYGIAELFEESIFALAHLCGLPAVAPWKRDNRNQGRTMAWDLPPSTVALIEDVFRHDYQFYAHAKRKFLERIAGIDFGLRFAQYKAVCAGEYKDRIL